MDARAHIGPSIVIKGAIVAQEDLVVAGRVEGTIQIEGFVVTVNPGGHVAADVAAKSIIVAGQVNGTLTAEDRIDVQADADVQGAMAAPRIRMAEGATFHGKVEMPKAAAKPLAMAS
jgi:cytoskeletal protein CcmA (bactofilin family)